MDQRTTTIDQDLKDIVDTRVAIAEKLGMLEQRIHETAEGAAMKFSRMLDETTQSVNQVVDRTKAALDPVHKVDEYPWLMLGGSVCLGFAIGLMESRNRSERSGVYPYYPSRARASRIMPESARQPGVTPDQPDGVYDYYPTGPQSHASQSDRARGSVWDSMSREFGEEAEQAKSVLMQVGRSLVLELARKMMPEVARSFGINLSPQTDIDKSASRQSQSHTAPSERGESRDRAATAT